MHYVKLHEQRKAAIKNRNYEEAKKLNSKIRTLEHKYKIPGKSRTARKNIFGKQTYYDTETGEMIDLK